MAGFLLDPSAPALGLLAAAAAGLGFLLSRDRTQAQPRHLWIAAAAALIALAVTLATGAWRPSLTARYLIPTAPGLLLGLGLCAKGGARPRLAAAALALAWLTAALWPGPFAAGLKRQSPYGFETASNILMRQDVGDVVFAWDHETARIMPAATLESLGETFFRRAGFPARVHALAIQPGDDVNALAIAAATGPRPGLIWIYNRAGRTAAALHPPRLPALDARWRCRRIGDETVGSLACWRD
jgi:hypothetical protein